MKDTVDRLVITNDYIGHILALFYARQGSTTLLLQDPRIKHVPFVYQQLNLIDREYLRLMGHELGIKALIDIDYYLRPRDRQIMRSGNIFKLSDSPFDNTIELLRKWHFDPEVYLELTSLGKHRFDPLFTNYAETIAHQCYKYENFQTLSSDIFYIGEETSFKNILKKIQENIAAFFLAHPSLLELLAQTFLGNIKKQYSQYDLYYIVYSLISPSFYLHETELSEHLKFSLMEREGEHTLGNINIFEFNSKAPNKAIMEDNIETIHFKKATLHGERINGGPLGIYREHNLFRTYLFKGKVSGPRFESILNSNLIMSQGKDYLWAHVDSEGYMELAFFAEEYVGGCKSEHFVKAKRQCFEIFHEYGLLIDESHFNIHQHAEFYGYLSRFSEKNRVLMIENRLTGQEVKSKDFKLASYFKRSPSGLFQYLSEVKSFYFRE